MAIYPDTITQLILEDVFKERQRQFDKLTKTNLWDCADPTTPWPNKHLVLSEEIGEVARCILEAGFADTILGFNPALRKELIQVAAVAVACVESIDRQGTEHASFV